MVNYPPNYKEQESYYSSQEYKDGVEKALESNNKLPTFEELSKLPKTEKFLQFFKISKKSYEKFKYCFP